MMYPQGWGSSAKLKKIGSSNGLPWQQSAVYHDLECSILSTWPVGAYPLHGSYAKIPRLLTVMSLTAVNAVDEAWCMLAPIFDVSVWAGCTISLAVCRVALFVAQFMSGVVITGTF